MRDRTYPLESLESVNNIPCFLNCIYNWLCRALILHLITFSILSGSSLSTSFFRRRSRNGRSTLCRRLIISSASSSLSSILSAVPELANGVLNHSSNDLTLLKILGRAKLSKAHNSGRLFWRGFGLDQAYPDRICTHLKRCTCQNETVTGGVILVKGLRKSALSVFHTVPLVYTLNYVNTHFLAQPIQDSPMIM
jgi:hypothetical protein